ncbi:hypothetical protein ACH47B_26410 [Rhodococcus sp. NPDC019627]|uniref:hypothetical protein n=1 Tax=unclassified Rhodococcus (in: high G+C Gram-positive bacteria) TaxID=192944 RepID=UPI0033F559CB
MDDDGFRADHDPFREQLDNIQRDIEIHALDMSFHLSGMQHANARGRRMLQWQGLFVVLAGIGVALNSAYGDYWWLASWICAIVSFGFGVPHAKYMKESRNAHKAFDALETPASLVPFLDAIEEVEKPRWWRRVLVPRCRNA